MAERAERNHEFNYSMSLTHRTSYGLFLSWQLIQFLGVAAVTLFGVLGIVWLIASQSAYERTVVGPSAANAATAMEALEGAASFNAINTVDRELEELSLRLAEGLFASQAVLNALIDQESILWARNRLSVGRETGWVGVDPLFEPVNEFSEGSIILVQGASGATGNGGTLADLLAHNEVLLNQAARTLESRTYISATRPMPLAPLGPSIEQLGQGEGEEESENDLNVEARSQAATPPGQQDTASRNLERELSDAVTRESALARTLIELEGLIDRLSEDNSRLELQLTATRLSERNAELKTSQLEAELRSAKASLENLEIEFSKVAEERLSLIQELIEFEAVEAELNTLIEQKNALIEERGQSIATLTGQLSQTQARAQALEDTRVTTINTVSANEIEADNMQLRTQLAQAQEMLAQEAAERDRLLAQIGEMRLAVARAEAASEAGTTAKADPAVIQAAVDAAVEAALVERSLETATATQVLQDALAAAKTRIDELEVQLTTSLVDQRFAEAEYSRALARAERLTAELERRAGTLIDVNDLQEQLLEDLSLRYRDLLDQEQAQLTHISDDILDLAPEASPLWESVVDAADGLGGGAFELNGEVDEFSGDLSNDGLFSIDPDTFASTTISFAMSLDQSLASLESLRHLKGNLPLGAPTSFDRISSHYGPRKNPVTGKYSQHRGIDLAGSSGTPIYVQAPGTVVFAGWQGGFGRFVEVMHEGGVKTRYAHLRRISVGEGQRLSKSDKIGELGSSGRSTGPHLHYEIMIGDKWVDPREWIKAVD